MVYKCFHPLSSGANHSHLGRPCLTSRRLLLRVNKKYSCLLKKTPPATAAGRANFLKAGKNLALNEESTSSAEKPLPKSINRLSTLAFSNPFPWRGRRVFFRPDIPFVRAFRANLDQRQPVTTNGTVKMTMEVIKIPSTLFQRQV